MSLTGHRRVSMLFASLLLALTAAITFISYQERAYTPRSALLRLAIDNHMWIMAGMLVVAVAFGFIWSSLLWHEISRGRRRSHSVMRIVFRFLTTQERKVLELLLERGGETTQAEIARLPNFNRLHAHRLVQRLQGKGLITIEAHGKVRRVRMEQEIYDVLTEPGD